MIWVTRAAAHPLGERLSPGCMHATPAHTAFLALYAHRIKGTFLENPDLVSPGPFGVARACIAVHQDEDGDTGCS